MTVRLLALIASLVLLSPQETDHESAPRPQHVEGAESCASCDGTGTRQTPCPSCGGDQVMTCARCTGSPLLDLDSIRLQRLWAVAHFGRQETIQVVAAVIKTLAEGKEERARRLLPADQRGGAVTCHKGCTFGVDAELTCTTCDGESLLECPKCEGAGELACRACKTGVVEQPCLPCRGHGQVVSLERLEEAPVAACSFCELSPFEDCGTCEGSRSIARPCPGCHGMKRLPCWYCAGAAHLECGACRGRGQFRTGAYTEPRRCNECRGKGCEPCGECRKGEMKCPTCAGGVRSKRPCPTCIAPVSKPCPGCMDDFSMAWRHASDRASRAGRTELATRLLEHGLERERTARAGLGARLDGSDVRLSEIEEEILLAELRRIDARIESLEARLGPAASGD